MILKVKIHSINYEKEFIGIQFNMEKNKIIIGGKEKMFFEINNYIEKFKTMINFKIDISEKKYINNIIRFQFTCKNSEFNNWIEILKSHDIKLSFVNSLERILR